MSGFWLTEEQEAIREGVAKVCAAFDDEYWRRTDETGEFPEAFVAAIAEGGWLGVAMPENVGGAGLGLTEAAVMMQSVAQSGAGFSGASAIHLNIFGPMPLVKFGSDEQRNRLLPRIISGEDKMCFAVTEPNSGLDTSSLETRAEKVEGGYRLNGRKIDLDDRGPARQQDPDHRAHNAQGSVRQAAPGPVAVLYRSREHRGQADPEDGAQGCRM